METPTLSGLPQTTQAPPLIADDKSLAQCVDRLRREDRVAVDTEADSLHCYFEKLCLIQISIPGEDLLVDPLAGIALDPLLQQLASSEIVLHGADYDLRLMRRVGLPEPRAVFDTMIAARLVGITEFSLGALVLHYFGVALTKGSQKANWARRPLSPEMMRYARNDTHFLLGLAERLGEELDRSGRRDWFEQSCARAIALTRINKLRDAENGWRISGSSDLSGRAAALLRALWTWRDQEARAVDRPPFHILQNSLLIEAALAFDAGRNLEPRHLDGSRKRRFIAAVSDALNLDEKDWPQPVRHPRYRSTSGQEQRFKAYKEKRDHAAAELKIDPSLIAPKATLEALAADREANVERLLPWQLNLLE